MRTSALVLASLPLFAVSAWKCDSIKFDGAHYDLSSLDTEHALETSTKTPPTIRHVSYAINPCAPLKKQKDVNSEDQCTAGTQICKTTAIEKDDKNTIIEVLAYAGDINDEDAPKIAKLKSSNGETSGGFKLTYTGEKDSSGTQLKASISFLCDKDTGVGKPELTDSEAGEANFTWRTKHACSDSSEDGGDKKRPDKRPDGDEHEPRPARGSWGFFTWLFLVVFMLIASFLIFTLFLNYNRYGQIGLDLVPAMDSVKDVPYLFKDFASQVVETVKGNGGRSGYSAV